MKNYFSNIRTLAALLIASAAFTACSNDESSIDQPVNPTEPKTYTLTLQAGKADGAQTRALALDGTSLVAKWEADDQLEVSKGSTSVGTLTASNVSDDGKTCTFSGALTGTIEVNDALTLVYHPVTTIAAYASQTGTLASAADYDVAAATVTVASVNEGEITIGQTSAEFTTQTAVLKITMTNGTDGTNALNATSLKILAGTTEIFTFSPTEATYTANGDGVLYFALPSQAAVEAAQGMSSGALSAVPITFTATVGSNTYTATKTGYTFAAGKYYATKLTMAKPLAQATTDDIGKVAGKDGKIYATKAGAEAVGTGNAVAMIAYVGNETDHGTYKHGLAIALTSESGSPMNWSNAKTACESKTEVTSATWLLPSMSQWKQMFKANGNNENSYSDLNSALTTAGGSVLQGSGSDYWTSNDFDTEAYFVSLLNGTAIWGETYNKNTVAGVRACLAF